MATSNAAGGTLGAYEPDFCGNYRYCNGYRPDTMGVTAKFYDSDSNFNYFGYRWYDQDRGKWPSMDPAKYGYNRYEFNLNNAANYIDIDGALPKIPRIPRIPPIPPVPEPALYYDLVEICTSKYPDLASQCSLKCDDYCLSIQSYKCASDLECTYRRGVRYKSMEGRFLGIPYHLPYFRSTNRSGKPDVRCICFCRETKGGPMGTYYLGTIMSGDSSPQEGPFW